MFYLFEELEMGMFIWMCGDTFSDTFSFTRSVLRMMTKGLASSPTGGSSVGVVAWSFSSRYFDFARLRSIAVVMLILILKLRLLHFVSIIWFTR